MIQNGDSASNIADRGKERSDCEDDAMRSIRLQRQRRNRRSLRPRFGKRHHHHRRNTLSLFLNYGGTPFVIFLLLLIALQLYIFTKHFTSPSAQNNPSLSTLFFWKQGDHRTNEALRRYKDFLSRRMRGQNRNQIHPGGVVILGMHRSGTSMLTGLLVEGLGFHVGQPLIQPAFDNEKGFYELLPVVLQNDEFMMDQHIDWSYDVIHFNPQLALKHFQDNSSQIYDFTQGTQALKFLNNPNNIPWVLKDPRLCITLPTWIPLLHSPPAAVFTYRHPLEVAASLVKRQEFTLEHGLRLWIVYNMRAIQNSKNLCRISSSNDKLLARPFHEVSRMVSDLVKYCHVIQPPKRLTQQVVDSFVDGSLQHVQRKTIKERLDEGQKVFQRFSDNCVAFEYKTNLPEGSNEYLREKNMYLRAMKVFCDLENGHAFQDNYEWPDMLN